MTLFLRTKNNQSIVDIELYNRDVIDISVCVDIELYSSLLLSLSPDKQDECVKDFSGIDNLRGWLFEYYEFELKHDGHDFERVLSQVKSTLISIGDKYGLGYIED